MKFKRLFLCLALAGTLCTLAAGCKDAPPQEDEKSVFPVSSYNGTTSVNMGDVMPFYDGEVMNIYHLQNSRGSLSTYYHPISRLTTTDYVHYKDEGVVIDFVEEFTSPDAAIGTGSFIKDEDGLYHCFYTGHNAEEGTGLPYHEVVRHATSPDQKTWTKIEDFNLYGNKNDFRDPYVYYDDVDECYYMLVTTQNDYGKGIIKRYSATSLMADDDEWIDRGVFFENDAGSYNMECPSYIEYNGYWYLAYSEQGENRVTHYRYRTERNGEWKKFERDTIDASGFYAGRLEKADDTLYAFAWCATLDGGSAGSFDWGGNLVAHQINQLSNGELCAVLISDVEELVSTPVEYNFASGDKVSEVSFDGEKFSARAINELNEGVTRISFNFTLGNYGGDCGITFGLGDTLDNRLGKALIAFEPKNNRLVCYNDVSSILRYGPVLSSVNFVYGANKSYEVDILVEGEVATIYLDETIAMTVRIPDIEGNGFAFYSNGAKVNFKGICFYE